MDRVDRPRRLRRDGLRDLVRETRLHASDLVAPVFVDATADEPRPIDAMPGQLRLPIDDGVAHVRDLTAAGIGGVLLFGIPESKDEAGSRAWSDDGVVQRATRRLVDATDATVLTDTCLCEYTSHGHCGVLEPDAREDPTLTVDNDATLDRLAEIAVSQAEAGAACVAPSAAMDGQVGAIRTALDDAGFTDVAILAYAVKTHSAFYGPFREAADGAPAFGDRRHYQGDPANAREATREVRLNVDEGADICMVKPALPNLDLVRDVRASTDRPVAAYNVSGEYAMLHAAADRGWLELDAAARESLLGIKRAGADVIVTYFADRIGPDLPD